MKKTGILRIFLGLMIVALGAMFLLQNLGIITQDMWPLYSGIFWGSAFVLGGASVALSGRQLWIAGVPLMMVGVGIVLRAFQVIDVNVWKIFWPVLLIAAGCAVLFRMKSSSKRAAAERDKIAIFYGDGSRVTGKYDGGSLTALFGGIELDLRDADIKDGTVIDTFVLCGGVSIQVPDTVIVKNEVRGVLGDSDDKTAPVATAKKTLHVRGDCILGGFEIK